MQKKIAIQANSLNSINIKNNLEDYKNINPCGLNNSLVTNLRSETKEDLIDIDKNLKKDVRESVKYWKKYLHKNS